MIVQLLAATATARGKLGYTFFSSGTFVMIDYYSAIIPLNIVVLYVPHNRFNYIGELPRNYRHDDQIITINILLTNLVVIVLKGRFTILTTFI